jgi:hypothetical protein
MTRSGGSCAVAESISAVISRGWPASDDIVSIAPSPGSVTRAKNRPHCRQTARRVSSSRSAFAGSSSSARSCDSTFSAKPASRFSFAAA